MKRLPSYGDTRHAMRRGWQRQNAKGPIRPWLNPLLRVGVDLDDTLISNDRVWRRYFQQQTTLKYCTKHRWVNDDEVATSWDFWERICPICWEKCVGNTSIVLQAHTLRPGAEKALKRLTKDGIEFTLITARPLTQQYGTYEWLRAKGLYPPRIFKDVIFAKSKAEVCLDKGIDILIDDKPLTIEQVASTKTVKTVLSVRPHNQDHVWGENKPDVFAYSWRDIEDYLVSVLALKEAMPHFDGLDVALNELKENHAEYLVRAV